MSRRVLLSLIAFPLIAATAAFAAPSIAKWPPWISIETPVNPFDPNARGALLLVHATFREGVAQLSDLTGTAEGIVDGARRTIPLRFESAGRPSIFALRKQWPSEGAWLLRIAVRSTTAIVTLDHDGNVAAVRVPTEIATSGDRLPRVVAQKEIDSTLAQIAKR
jgi:hypothetical protein